MEFSWAAWAVSVLAVLASALLAWRQRNFAKRPGLDMGFVNHGGMWGDLVLLPIANAMIVPHLQPGAWLIGALALGSALSAWVHVHWYRGERVRGSRFEVRSSEFEVRSSEFEVRSSKFEVRSTASEHVNRNIEPGTVERRSIEHRTGSSQAKPHSSEHMWPSRPHGVWWRDLSWAGRAHVVYVACELSVLIGFLLFPMPGEVVAIVWAIFTLHLPLGLLQPRWFLTGEIVGPRKQPLLLPCLAAVWLMSWVKL